MVKTLWIWRASSLFGQSKGLNGEPLVVDANAPLPLSKAIMRALNKLL